MLKIGTYRNEQGVTIEITNLLPMTLDDGTTVLGQIYEGYSDDRAGLFGRKWYLVTEESFAAFGYELVSEATGAEEQVS